MTRPPLTVAGVVVATSITAAWDCWYAALAISRHPEANDFRNYYTAATLGIRDGWSRLYDLHLQQQVAAALGVGWAPFANPPPLAWLAAPFALLPYRAADLAWLLLLMAAFIGAWWVAAPGRGLARLAALTAAIGLFPIIFAFVLGQACLLVAAAVVLAWWLLRRGQPIAAGLALSLIVLKPQDALLLPLALLVGGRGRVFAAWFVATALLVIVSAISLGSDGIARYRDALGFLIGLDLGRGYALTGLIGSSQAAHVVQLLLGVATLLIAWRRRSSLEAVVFVGVVGSFLVAPYLSLQDQAVLVVAAWILLRERITAALAVLLAATYVALEFAIPFGGAPVIVLEAALLLAASFHHDQDRRAEKDDPEGRKDAADHRQHHLE